MATPVYKRPTVVRKACAGYSNSRAVSPYASGVVADICRKMRSSSPAPFRKPEWTPPLGHASYFAALKARGENTEQYERLTEEFYLKHPPPPKPELDLSAVFVLANKYYGQGEPSREELSAAMQACGVSEYDALSYVMGAETIEECEYIRYTASASRVTNTAPNQGPMLELNERYYSRGQIPPVPAVTRAMRKAGYSEERVERYVKWNKRMEETYEERTAALEKIFAKWPSASKGPVKKVIKAVKKNL